MNSTVIIGLLIPFMGTMLGSAFVFFMKKDMPVRPQAHIEVFPGMNHGQLLIDHPEEIAQRITKLLIQTSHIQ